MMRLLLLVAALGAGEVPHAADATKCPPAMAAAAEVAAANATTWQELSRAYSQYDVCDDGSIWEGFSDSVTQLLASDGAEWRRLAALTEKNERFLAFVLKHIDELMPQDRSVRIEANARDNCPTEASRICRSVLEAVLSGPTPGGRDSRPHDGRPHEICGGTDSNMRCLARNLDALYAADYRHFWAILHASAPAPDGCVPDRNTVDFLSLARVKTVNAEFDEFFAEHIETLCVRSPECFRGTFEHLDRESRERIRKRLETPTFLNREDLARAKCLGDAPAKPGAK